MSLLGYGIAILKRSSIESYSINSKELFMNFLKNILCYYLDIVDIILI